MYQCKMMAMNITLADNNNIFLSHINHSISFNNINSERPKISAWFTLNKLYFNIKN